MADTSTRIEKVKAPDMQRFLEEIRSLKNRLQGLELAKLEESRLAVLDASGRETARRAKGGAPEETLRARQEARRYVDAEHENSKAILASKYDKFEANLQSLSKYLGDLAPLRELEAKLPQEAERLRKHDEEARVRRRVLDHEVEELGREKELHRATSEALVRREAEVRAKLADLDVVRRARDLSQLQSDLDGKIKAYEGEAALLTKQREELNRDFDKLGEKRAELDREAGHLSKEREALRIEESRLADSVARGMAKSFEALVRDLLAPPAG